MFVILECRGFMRMIVIQNGAFILFCSMWRSSLLLRSQIKYCPFYCVSDEFKEQNFDGRRLKTNLAEQRNLLREIIQLDYGFLDILFGYEEWSTELLRYIKQTPYNKNDIFLDFLLHRYAGDYSEVMEALAVTGQQHVVNFVISGGGKRSRLFQELSAV
jgi:hypothetical protein